jgi:hypothetical protein
MIKKRKHPKTYQKRLLLNHLTFEQVVDKVLAYKPTQQTKKQKKRATLHDKSKRDKTRLGL